MRLCETYKFAKLCQFVERLFRDMYCIRNLLWCIIQTLIYLVKGKTIMKYSLTQAKKIIEKSMQVSSIECIGYGNHSEAFCVNGEIVIKLPKHRKASNCLKTEIQVLRGLEGKTDLNIPNVLFEGTFFNGSEEFVYFASKLLNGRKLSRTEFLSLDNKTSVINSKLIAKFLYGLHNERQILPVKKSDCCLIHGDFSLNHLLFNEENIVCGVLDFGDSRVGKPKSDFVYLLDDEDDEEFGLEFGRMVLKEYKSMGINDNIIF